MYKSEKIAERQKTDDNLIEQATGSFKCVYLNLNPKLAIPSKIFICQRTCLDRVFKSK